MVTAEQKSPNQLDLVGFAAIRIVIRHSDFVIPP